MRCSLRKLVTAFPHEGPAWCQYHVTIDVSDRWPLTSKGWFQQLSAPPIVDANIFSPIVNFASAGFDWNERMCPSANLAIPMRDAQPLICLKATALTPRFTPRIPSFRRMPRNISIVPGMRTPGWIFFGRVTSTVFMQVVMPCGSNVRDVRWLKTISCIFYVLTHC
jgi:hypothetical protein